MSDYSPDLLSSMYPSMSRPVSPTPSAQGAGTETSVLGEMYPSMITGQVLPPTPGAPAAEGLLAGMYPKMRPPTPALTATTSSAPTPATGPSVEVELKLPDGFQADEANIGKFKAV